jgi:hypothetical protein
MYNTCMISNYINTTVSMLIIVTLMVLSVVLIVTGHPGTIDETKKLRDFDWHVYLKSLTHE